MKGEHHYTTTVRWTGNKGQGTSHYSLYERSHTVSVENKVDLLCSSDPAFRGDDAKYNPEDLLVASISSCHMLWYLHVCSEAGVVVIDYTDHATGTMVETAVGGGHFSEVTLHPVVIVSDASMLEKASALHDEAHKFCFIANSCNFPIHHKATSEVGISDQ